LLPSNESNRRPSPWSLYRTESRKVIPLKLGTSVEFVTLDQIKGRAPPILFGSGTLMKTWATR
jgi:hypothetical protein